MKAVSRVLAWALYSLNNERGFETMEEVYAAYSRRCLLDDTKDPDYAWKARGMADQIYEGLASSSPEIRRVDVVISKVLWRKTGEYTNAFSFYINGNYLVQFQVDECFLAGAAAVVERLLFDYKKNTKILNEIKVRGETPGRTAAAASSLKADKYM